MTFPRIITYIISFKLLSFWLATILPTIFPTAENFSRTHQCWCCSGPPLFSFSLRQHQQDLSLSSGLSYEGKFKFRFFFGSPLVYGSTHLCKFTIDLKTLSGVRIYKALDFWMFLNNAMERDMEGTCHRKMWRKVRSRTRYEGPDVAYR